MSKSFQKVFNVEEVKKKKRLCCSNGKTNSSIKMEALLDTQSVFLGLEPSVLPGHHLGAC